MMHLHAPHIHIYLFRLIGEDEIIDWKICEVSCKYF